MAPAASPSVVRVAIAPSPASCQSKPLGTAIAGSRFEGCASPMLSGASRVSGERRSTILGAASRVSGERPSVSGATAIAGSSVRGLWGSDAECCVDGVW